MIGTRRRKGSEVSLTLSDLDMASLKPHHVIHELICSLMGDQNWQGPPVYRFLLIDQEVERRHDARCGSRELPFQ